MNRKIIVEDKKFDFIGWKAWVKNRISHLDHGIHVLKQAGQFADEELKKESERAWFSKHHEKVTLESYLRRATGNDTVDIIARDMKKKALRDIKEMR